MFSPKQSAKKECPDSQGLRQIWKRYHPASVSYVPMPSSLAIVSGPHRSSLSHICHFL